MTAGKSPVIAVSLEGSTSLTSPSMTRLGLFVEEQYEGSSGGCGRPDLGGVPRPSRIAPGALPPLVLVHQDAARLGGPSGGSSNAEDNGAFVDCVWAAIFQWLTPEESHDRPLTILASWPKYLTNWPTS